MASIDTIAEAINTGTHDSVTRAQRDLHNGLTYLAATARSTAAATQDPDLAHRLASLTRSLETAAEEFGGRLPLWRVTFQDGHQARVRASDETEAQTLAQRKAARRGPLGILGRPRTCPQIESIAQIA